MNHSETSSPWRHRWLALVGLWLVGCASGPRVPDLGRLYDRLAQDHSSDRNPVVVIPGLLGSNLVDAASGTTVWGAFGGDYANPNEPEGARLVALPMRRGDRLDELVDRVRENGALESIEVRVLGLPIGVNAYFQILMALGAIGGYRDAAIDSVDYGDDHFTCFQFAYDWRRDISESAARLHEFLVDEREAVTREYERRGMPADDVRFDVVAHSMGGLVLRYFLRYGSATLPDDGSLPELTWAGAELVERAILVGTPNAGSMVAFEELLTGTKIGPFTPRYRPAIVGTMPAAYQLLPRSRHGAWATTTGQRFESIYDVATWERNGGGLFDESESACIEFLLPDVPEAIERRAITRDHVGKCLRRAEQLHRALDVPATPPDGTELFLAVGDATDTKATAFLDATDGSVVRYECEAGDGTVLRSSALGDERVGGEFRPRLVSPIGWERVMFFFDDHLGLTQSAAFIDNLLFTLLEEPRRE